MATPQKFNPYDLSAKQPPRDERNFIHIPVKQELNKPLSLFLGRCDMFLERAKTLGQTDATIELQKILSNAKYLQNIINSSSILSKLSMEFELGSAAQLADGAKVTHGHGHGHHGENKTAIVGQSHPEFHKETERGNILVADDDRRTRELLKFVLEDLGHTVVMAAHGQEALEMIHTSDFDLVLTDIVMPDMNGYQLLNLLKADMTWRNIPVIVLSGMDETSAAARCIQMGAEDYLTKPIDAALLQGRINACLEKKRLRDLEQGYVQQLQTEQEKSERLLLNILPAPIAARLKAGEKNIADHYEEATVLFADIAGFTRMAAEMEAEELVVRLNEIFSAFDRLAEHHGLEKIKTIGDAYMVVGGLPTPRPDHCEAVAALALDLQHAILHFNLAHGVELNMRIGLHVGPVIGGVIGTSKFSYDLWGDTVNIASRMESSGQEGQIQTTEATYERLKEKFLFVKRGAIDVRGKGAMKTYFLTGRKI